MSNIFENITFTSDKPATYLVHKSDTVTYLAIGLLKNQLLKEHQTAFPALQIIMRPSNSGIKNPYSNMRFTSLNIPGILNIDIVIQTPIIPM